MGRSAQRHRMVLGAVALAATLVVPATGQRVVVEVKGGGVVGNYTDTGAGLDAVPGPVFGAVVELRATSWLAGYLGFTRSTFGCEEGFCINRDVSVTSQGLVIGARWSPGLPWARAGLVYQALDIEAVQGGGTSDPGLGIELGGGVEIPLGGRIGFRPGITYVRHDASTELGDGHVAMLALELGVAMGLASF